MPRIADGSTITVRSDDDGDARLGLGDTDLGRVRGSQIEVGELTATHVEPGERATTVLMAGGRTPVLRLDPAGRKATWLTLSRSRARLGRQRWRPFMERWILTRDVEGPAVLTVSTTPLGTRVSLVDGDGFTDREVEALVAGALVVALGIPVADTADV